MAVITGYYVNPKQVKKIDPWPGGHQVLFGATSDHLSIHQPNKNERATDSCFALIGAQCGVLMVDAG